MQPPQLTCSIAKLARWDGGLAAALSIPAAARHAVYFYRLFRSVAKTGGNKCAQPWWKVFWLGILAGAYLGLGATFYLYVAGQMPSIEKSDPGVQHLVLGAFGLPMGLGLIVVTGAELLTANSVYTSAAVFEVRF